MRTALRTTSECRYPATATSYQLPATATRYRPSISSAAWPAGGGPIRRAPFAHANDDAAEDRRIHVEVRHHLLAERRARAAGRSSWRSFVVRLARHGHRRVHATLDLVDEIVILVRDRRDQHLPAVRDERLDEAHEVARQLVAVRLLDDLVLLLRADARRLEEDPQAAVGSPSRRRRPRSSRPSRAGRRRAARARRASRRSSGRSSARALLRDLERAERRRDRLRRAGGSWPTRGSAR